MQFKLVENYINTCMKNGIFLWGIVRKKQTLIQAKIGVQDLSKAKEIASEHGCKIEIKRQRGIPFLIERYKNRKIFFILLFIVIAYFWLVKICMEY